MFLNPRVLVTFGIGLAWGCSSENGSVGAPAPAAGAPIPVTPNQISPSTSSEPGVLPPAATQAPLPVSSAEAPTGATEAACLPGRTGLQRLTARQYQNTLNELLGPGVPEIRLPRDPLKGGFENNASALGMTPDILDRYVSAAEEAVDATIGADPAWLGCTPATTECLNSAVLDFAERAYRRPLTQDDSDELLSLVSSLQATPTAQGMAPTPHQVMGWASVGIVTSPKVLFVALDRGTVNETVDGQSERFDAYGVASRLSYFLWSAPPDETLLERAADSSLLAPGGLAAEAQRLLSDPRAEHFIETFAVQWLDLTALDQQAFDDAVVTGLSSTFLEEMTQEAIGIVRQAVRSDQPISNLLLSQTTRGSEALAEHYGGLSRGEEIQLPTDQRRGILTQAGVLASTSAPDHTSIASRGMWVMENLLCMTPPPPPPEAVDAALAPVPDGAEPLSQRQRFQVHRDSDACRGCHLIMDELGFGLENYDPVGRFRTTEPNGVAIDASGQLPDGTVFSGAVDLAEKIANQPGQPFERCVTENLARYSVGRLLTPGDECFLEHLLSRSGGQQATFAQLVSTLVQSDLFLTQQWSTQVESTEQGEL